MIVGVTDGRFTRAANDLAELLSVVDVDEVEDVALLLMFLLRRPIDVRAISNDDCGFDGGCDGLEVIVWADHCGYGNICPFPVAMLEVARTSAEAVSHLHSEPDAWDEGEFCEASPDLSIATDAELIASLQRALGMVRLTHLMSAGE